jgi:hypothetical protein
MVIAYDNAQRRHGATTFLLRVETISENCEELKLVRRSVSHRSSAAHRKSANRRHSKTIGTRD